MANNKVNVELLRQAFRALEDASVGYDPGPIPEGKECSLFTYLVVDGGVGDADRTE